MKRGAAADRYTCVPVRTWDDLRVRGLDLAPSPAALYAWLAAGPLSSRVPGVVTGGPLAIAEAIGWAPEVCLELLAALELAGVAHVDRIARIVYLPQLLAAECSRPSSPSTAAMWSRELHGLVACDLRARVISDARAIIDALGAAQLESFDTGRDPQAGKPRSRRNLSGDQTGNLTGSQSGNHRARDLALDLELEQFQKNQIPLRDAAASAPAARGNEGGAPAGAGAGEVELEQLVLEYGEAWVAKFTPADGKAPAIERADRAQLRAAVKAHGVQAVRGFIERYLDEADAWLRSRGHKLRDLPGRIDGYRGGNANGQTRAGFAPPMAPATHGGKVAL